MEGEVNLAISDPDEIRRSDNGKVRRFYYRQGPMQHPNELIKVVAEFGRQASRGRLLTCYLVRGVTPGETSEWQRP